MAEHRKEMTMVLPNIQASVVLTQIVCGGSGIRTGLLRCFDISRPLSGL